MGAANAHDLRSYFCVVDGDLPEVEMHFADRASMVAAFAFLLASGAREVNRIGGIDDEGFLTLLAGIDCDGVIPDLGVLVWEHQLTFDYQPGSAWNDAAIAAFIRLLRHLRDRGGKLAVPYWGDAGERDFRAALDNPAS